MPDIEAIISNAVSAAEASGDLPDGGDAEPSLDPAEPTETVETTDEADPATAAAVVADGDPADPATKSAPEEKVVEGTEKLDAKKGVSDEVSKLLEAAGIKAPKPGERENKIPYSRVLKITGNALKKRDDAYTTALTERDGRITQHEARLESFNKVDRLIAEDPDRYMSILAQIHPNLYGKYLKPAAATYEKKATDTDTPMPEPDFKFEDGSIGYSVDQKKKYDQWFLDQATKRAVAQMREENDKRLGPFEKEQRAAAAIAQARPKIQALIRDQKELWGDYYPKEGSKEEKAVQALMQQNDGRQGRPLISFETALAKVLVPKQRADRNTMRGDLIKELQEKPKKAVSSAPGASKATVESEGSRDTEAVIRQAMEESGLL